MRIRYNYRDLVRVKNDFKFFIQRAQFPFIQFRSFFRLPLYQKDIIVLYFVYMYCYT